MRGVGATRSPGGHIIITLMTVVTLCNDDTGQWSHHQGKAFTARHHEQAVQDIRRLHGCGLHDMDKLEASIRVMLS